MSDKCLMITMETDILNNYSEDVITRIDNLCHEFQELKMESRNMPRGSQEFQKALLESEIDMEPEENFRRRSHTIDSSYSRPKNHVHFPSKLVTEPCKHGSSDELHQKGILRHCEPRERSKTMDKSHVIRQRIQEKMKERKEDSSKHKDHSKMPKHSEKQPSGKSHNHGITIPGIIKKSGGTSRDHHRNINACFKF